MEESVVGGAGCRGPKERLYWVEVQVQEIDCMFLLF